MERRYDGAIQRFLRHEERRVDVNEGETPLVIQPSERADAEFLRVFLERHSPRIVEDISTYGAVLLRGFNIESALEFEQAILRIRGIQGMGDYLLSEPGRSIVDGTNFVFYTNKLYKTGGTLHLGGFHSENCGVPEVPHYVCFWCQLPGTFGGETGLVNTAKVYSDLPSSLKRKLEANTSLAALYLVEEVMKRYGIRADEIETFYGISGLPVIMVHDAKHVAIYKPLVVQHPRTQERALVACFSLIPGIDKALISAFWGDYLKPHWLLHRLFWKTPWVTEFVSRLEWYWMRIRGWLSVRHAAELPSASAARSSFFDTLFSAEEINVLAESMRRRYSSFLWQRGDILILDNLKIAHAGMPGYGRRELKVMLCNSIILPTSATASGLYAVSGSDESLEKIDTA